MYGEDGRYTSICTFGVVLNSILHWVSWIALRLKKSQILTRLDEEILKNLQLPIRNTSPRYMKQVVWSRPKKWVV